jgi:hypothetical protein
MRVVGTLEYLKGLAVFLNAVHPKMTKRQWAKFRHGIEKHAIGGWFSSMSSSRKTPLKMQKNGLPSAKGRRKEERISLEEAKLLRQEMRDALGYLRADPLKSYKWADGETPYTALVENLNSLRLEQKWYCEPAAGKLRPGQAILYSHGKRWVAQSWPYTITTPDFLYSVLGAALLDGSINRLKMCPNCEKFLIAKDRKRRWCSNQCKDNFHNERRLRDGTFEAYRAARATRARGKL